MNANHFLIGLLAIVSVAGSMAAAALLTRPGGMSMAPAMTSATPAATAPSSDARPSAAEIEARVEALRQRLLDDPDDGEGWKMLGRSMMAMGRLTEAVAAYSRASQLMPNDAEVRGALTQLQNLARERGAHDDDQN